jgi:hypothetical protein
MNTNLVDDKDRSRSFTCTPEFTPRAYAKPRSVGSAQFVAQEPVLANSTA